MSTSTVSIASQRQALRKTFRAKREQLSSKQQKLEEKQLLALLKNNIDVNKAENIAIYLSNDGELNTRLFIQWCWQQNKKTYLPVVHPFSRGQLLFLQYHAQSQLISNKYGILEPELDVRLVARPQDLDIIFTPLVAFDQQGSRLGMGGGFYDRTLARWFREFQHAESEQIRDTLKPYPIGLAHDCQRVEHLPVESWDVPLPKIITPSTIYHFEL